MPKKNSRMPPVHPGEILREDLMKPLRLTVTALARDLKIPANRMSEIVNGRRSVNADAALRLSRYFGNTRILDQPSGRLRSPHHSSFLCHPH